MNASCGAIARPHATVIRHRRDALLPQQSRNLLDVPHGGRIHDRGIGQAAQRCQELPLLVDVTRHRLHGVGKVGTMNSRADDAQRADTELPRDVLDNFGRCGGRQRQHGRRSEAADRTHRFEVRRPEIVAPLADAVRFIDDEQIDVGMTQHRSELGGGELFRCGEDELDAPPPDFGARALNVAGRHGTVDLHSRQSKCPQLFELIPHQRNQGRHHEGHSGLDEGWSLVAEGLAGAGRHDGKGVPAGEHRVDHGALPRPELADAENPAQNAGQPDAATLTRHD
jgi:hypothetical protein